jgi:hypothetical protein
MFGALPTPVKMYVPDTLTPSAARTVHARRVAHRAAGLPGRGPAGLGDRSGTHWAEGGRSGHSMIWSARSSSEGAIARPRALADLRFTTSSY